MFNGYIRKIVFALIGWVALGWLLIIIGFGIETNRDGLSVDGSYRYPWWIVILLTPFMLIMAVVQAAIDNNRLAMNIIGAITTFLSALFLTALGYLLTFYGGELEIYRLQPRYYYGPIDSSALQFSGAIIATIFWVALTCVSHFYEREGDLVTG